MSALSKEQLLAEIEATIRDMPPITTIRHADRPENAVWFGRASAVIENWNPSKRPFLKGL